MADVAPTLARRVFVALVIAVVGVALGAVVAGGVGVPPGRWTPPSAATLVALALGLASGAIALRATLALRLLVTVLLFALAGAAVIGLRANGSGPLMLGVTVAFALGPIAMWSMRAVRGVGPPDRAPLGLILLATFVGAGLLRAPIWSGRALLTFPPALIVLLPVVAGILVASLDPGEARPIPARFDLRAALALGALATSGFVIAFWAGTLALYAPSLATRGMGALRSPALWALLAVGIFTGWRGGARAATGLFVLLLGMTLALLGGLGLIVGYLILVPTGIVLAVEASIRRAERAGEGLGAAMLLVAIPLGMPLAAGLVRGFTRPLLGAVPGIGAATETNWTFVLGFYALLALVVLLAHLAHAYEFGFAALDPDDDRDPLPILRKGLPKFGTKA